MRRRVTRGTNAGLARGGREFCVPVRVLCVPVRRSVIGMGYDRTGSCRAATAPLHVEQLGLVEYRTAWDAQRAHAAARRAGTGPDVLMLLEHPPVYTAGKRTRPADRPTDGTPVVDVDRGGLITWHGPGQLVGYPLVGARDADGRRGLRASPGGGADRRGRRHGPAGRRAGGRAHRRLVARGRPRTRAQGRRHRRAGPGRRDDARLRAQLRSRPDLVRPDRALRDHRRRGDVAGRRAGPARGRGRDARRDRRSGRGGPRRSGCRWSSTSSTAPRPPPAWTSGSTPRCSS